MADRLGPRSCAVCGPQLDGCWRCGGKFGHVHVVVVSRAGKTLGRVAACGAHAPKSGEMLPGGVEVASRAALSDASASAKRRRDRERRKAQRMVLDRHADEVAAVLVEIRGDA
ncbi:hypothetical protein [Egicoccus sp. AB-alg2]|uniref:hypothetical protein n=1 Tax=Egicoccus sp. AB-alg2 TaxID=3242693 RepID=UPI00359E8F28